eukprot:m.178359 g.178359  ORF g.178359 m.178359 type:complete len:173 (+) comp14639_c0_seq23:156-674(+)
MAERDASVSPTPQSRQEQVLQEPYKYITQVPGKDIRSKLIMAFDAWLQVPEDKLTVIKAVTKILHNASLLYANVSDVDVQQRWSVNIVIVPQDYCASHVSRLNNSSDFYSQSCRFSTFSFIPLAFSFLFSLELMTLKTTASSDGEFLLHIKCMVLLKLSTVPTTCTSSAWQR